MMTCPVVLLKELFLLQKLSFLAERWGKCDYCRGSKAAKHIVYTIN